MHWIQSTICYLVFISYIIWFLKSVRTKSERIRGVTFGGFHLHFHAFHFAKNISNSRTFQNLFKFCKSNPLRYLKNCLKYSRFSVEKKSSKCSEFADFFKRVKTYIFKRVHYQLEEGFSWIYCIRISKKSKLLLMLLNSLLWLVNIQ